MTVCIGQIRLFDELDDFRGCEVNIREFGPAQNVKGGCMKKRLGHLLFLFRSGCGRKRLLLMKRARLYPDVARRGLEFGAHGAPDRSL
ncbi:hypothetical protein DSM25558_3215 [Agrobacterium sp. DSM 25558]|nr:hypothetical protein DSM25558_3215 [Agrobacterium sp. DSM 25558]